MVDFKKKKKGFSGIMESLKSDKSKFEDLWIEFIVDQVNDAPNWNIIDFPNGLKGRKIKLSTTFLDNFPKKHIVSDFPLLKKISNIPELNLSELIEKLVYFSWLGDGEDDTKYQFNERCFSKFQCQLEDSNTSFSLSQDEWSQMFTEFSGYFSEVVFIDESVIPDVSVLCHKDFLNIGEEGINNCFRTYCLMIGHYLLYGGWITFDIKEEINSFLKKNTLQRKMLVILDGSLIVKILNIFIHFLISVTKRYFLTLEMKI